MSGRPKGSLVVGSVQHWLSTFEVGDVRWKETTIERYQHEQREINCAKSRRVESMIGRTFIVGLFTAVSASKAGAIQYLLRIERTA